MTLKLVTSDQKDIVDILDVARKQADTGDFKAIMLVCVTKDNKHKPMWAGDVEGLGAFEKMGMLFSMAIEIQTSDDRVEDDPEDEED